MTRMGVLNNLRAGKGASRYPKVRDWLRRHPDVPHVETESAEAVPEALRWLAGREVDLLVVNGGDGSVQRTLTEILCHGAFERPPLLAPIRGGRTNMTALDLGTQRSATRALDGLLRAAREDALAPRIVERRVLRLRQGEQGWERCGMFFGTGVIHRAVEFVHRVFPPGRSQGAVGSGLVTGVLIARLAALGDRGGILTPDKMLVALDGEPLSPGEFYTAFASTLGRLFLRMQPFWGREEAPLRLTALSSDAVRVARAVPGILRGRPAPFVTPENGYVSRNVRRADLQFGCGFTIDGEQFPEGDARSVHIDADRAVRFVRA